MNNQTQNLFKRVQRATNKSRKTKKAKTLPTAIASTTRNAKREYRQEDYITSFDVPPSWSKIQQIYKDHHLSGLYNILTSCLDHYAVIETNVDIIGRVMAGIRAFRENRKENSTEIHFDKIHRVTSFGATKKKTTTKKEDVKKNLTDYQYIKGKRDERVFIALLLFLKNMVPMVLISYYFELILSRMDINAIFDTIIQRVEFKRMKALKKNRIPKKYIYPDDTSEEKRKRQRIQRQQHEQRQPQQSFSDRVIQSESERKYTLSHLQRQSKAQLEQLLKNNNIPIDPTWSESDMITKLVRQTHRYGTEFPCNRTSLYRTARWMRPLLKPWRCVTGIVVRNTVPDNLRTHAVTDSWSMASREWYKRNMKRREFEKGQIGYVVRTRDGEKKIIVETRDMYNAMMDFYRNYKFYNSKASLFADYDTVEESTPPPPVIMDTIPVSGELAPGLFMKLGIFLNKNVFVYCDKCHQQNERNRYITFDPVELRRMQYCSDVCMNQALPPEDNGE